VQIKKENGESMEVDITWNPKLKPYGFKTFPENWDGRSAFIGINNIIKRWNGANISDMKAKFIDSLNPELRERRERFLRKFIEWVKIINNQ